LAVFQTCLGKVDGVVSVGIVGDAYAITLDASPMIAAIPVQDMMAAMLPVMMMATDNSDGAWADAIDQPVTLDYSIPDQIEAKTTYGSVQVIGVFDETLGESSQCQIDITGITTEQTLTDANLGTFSIKSVAKSMIGSGMAKPAASGADSTFSALSTGMAYDVTLPAGPEGPPITIAVVLADAAVGGTIAGYQPSTVYGLLAWFVAHPDQAMIMADKASLMAKIESALPIFENIAMTGGYSDVSATTPVGDVALDELGLTIEMNGFVPDGLIREAVSFCGLTLSDGVVPPFATALMPDKFRIDVAASSFDLQAASKLGLTLFDLPEGATPPEGFEMQTLAAILPAGAVDITLAPAGAANETYALTYEGAMSVGMDGMPVVGTGTVTLDGVDGSMAALTDAPPEMSGQIIPVLGMAQAMGAQGPDGELVWTIDASTPGCLMINGVDLMGGQ
jgi:hypothetical protein